MKTKTLLFACMAGLLLNGCAAYEKKNQAGAAVVVNGKYLYQSTLDSLTLGLSSEDSLRVVQQYVSQWSKDILMYDAAKARSNSAIEALVEDYRRTLYVHAYEEYLVEQRMPKSVTDSTVQDVYEHMPERFRLDESIVKGLMVVVPNDAPNIARLRNWMTNVDLDHIEKYAYQNASGYELFEDRWLTATEIIAAMPIQRAELEAALKSKNQIEVADTLKTYILQVTDKQLRGEKMPIDYARPEIEKLILNARQVEFLQKERERLYNEAIQDKKIVFLSDEKL